MRRVRPVRSALAALLILLPACSTQPGGPAGPALTPASLEPAAALSGPLNVWSWNIAAKSLQNLTPAFERHYPHIHPDVDMTGANMQARLLLSLAADVGAPDVSQLQCEEAPRYTCTGKLADLTDVAAGFRTQFPAALWHNCVYKGRVYAIPWDMGPCAVYYKRNIFQRYGIAPKSIRTWDDFLEAGRQILSKSHGRTKMLPLDTNAITTIFQLLIQQDGGQVFDEDGRVVVNSPQARLVVRLLQRMIRAGIGSNVKLWGQEFMAGLNDDSIATYPEAAWFAGTIKDAAPDYGGKRQQWGVFRLPALIPGGIRISNHGGSVLVIPAQSRHKAAAWAFIRYALCTTEGQLAQYKSENLFPAYLPALKSQVFDAPDPFFGSQRIGRLFATDVTKLPALNRTKDWMEATTYINETFSKWVDNGMQTDVLAELAQKLHRRLGAPIGPTLPATRLQPMARSPRIEGFRGPKRVASGPHSSAAPISRRDGFANGG